LNGGKGRGREREREKMEGIGGRVRKGKREGIKKEGGGQRGTSAIEAGRAHGFITSVTLTEGVTLKPTVALLSDVTDTVSAQS
jgi:hypothetical protein